MDFFKDLSFVNQILFPAPTPTYTKNTSFNEAKLVNLESKDTYALSFNSPGNRYWLLYFHGNCCDLGSMYPHLLSMHKYSNANILAVEYYGYGISYQSKGMSESRAYLLAKKAWNYLTKILLIPSNRIVIFGRSIGTGIASYLAEDCKDVGGLILHSPFISIKSLAYEYIGWANIFVFERFNTLKRIRSYKNPLLIIHADKDEVVPLSHGITIFDQAKISDKLFVLQLKSNHNSFKIYDYFSVVKNFLNIVKNRDIQNGKPEEHIK